ISSVINGGSYYEPHVVKQILNDQGNVVRKVGPELVRKTVSQSTSEFLCHALFMTVEEGTGKVAQVEGFKVGGKTGTAEKIPRSAKNYLLSFAGFAPADDPRILIYVIVDTPNLPPGPEQAHSSFATGIFQKILVEALPYLNVFPDTPVPEEEDDLSGRTEGITNNNEGGLEPAPERGAESGGEETESGEALESTAGEGETEPGQGGQESTEESTASESEEVIPFEGGLGLPDNVPGGLAVETLPAETAAP
ncbi:MAG: penicillin-binding protein 2, partial [Lachnospiraceae bacterium]|nr:penicillin-binding protein 2 [Lachnospiraceae bacterium]